MALLVPAVVASRVSNGSGCAFVVVVVAAATPPNQCNDRLLRACRRWHWGRGRLGLLSRRRDSSSSAAVSAGVRWVVPGFVVVVVGAAVAPVGEGAGVSRSVARVGAVRLAARTRWRARLRLARV